MGKIISMKRGDFPIDSFVIMPGVTHYKNIYTNGNYLFFSQEDYKQSITIEFTNEGELDRFFTMLMREIKLNQLINVETKNTK
jgi:hypothetical protein